MEKVLNIKNLFFFGDIDSTNADYRTMCETLINPPICDIIKIHIDSHGGSTNEGIVLYNLMRNCKIPVHTYCLSKAESSAFFVFLGGTKRYCYTNSYFLWHESKLTMDSIGLVEALSAVNEATNQQNEMDKIVMDRTKIPRKLIKEINNSTKDYIFTSKDALKYKIVDKILKN